MVSDHAGDHAGDHLTRHQSYDLQEAANDLYFNHRFVLSEGTDAPAPKSFVLHRWHCLGCRSGISVV
jgi:hypothetical protein